jgi:glycosyltransferase involved in cell wall biosynthesis
VISSDAGGLPEININGVTGFMSSIGDVKSMSANAIDLLSNEEKLNIFKSNAAKQAIKFDVHKIVPQYEALYERVLMKNAVLS